MAFLSGIGRARHIPTRTDTVVRFAPEHVVLFLRLCNLGSKEMPQGYYSKWRSSGGYFCRKILTVRVIL